MRDTIDFGIELGTTNSAIAVFANGRSRIIKNNENWDYTPSAVWIPRPDRIHVGRRARERLEHQPDDAYAGFMRLLGTAGASYTFRRAGLTLTPEELAAEVLKSLCKDAAHELGEPPAAAVITVPASFAINQSNAVLRAAALAGLGEECPLLHEPVAAALAYAAHEPSGGADRLVFALGSDDFTVALVGERDGELGLLGYAGDPHLGGEDIDRAIVDRLLAPAAARELGLRDFTRGNARWRTDFAKLKFAAEQAKIELSRSAESELFVDLRVDDYDEEEFTYVLTRGALDDLALPLYARAVRLCREVLADASPGPGHVDRVLLVGGATRAAGLRELLADPREGLGLRVDHSQDPTTAVARGAALFAATVSLPAPPPRGRDEIADLLYETRELLGRCATLLDQAGPGVPGRLRAAVARLRETVARLESDLGGGGGTRGWQTAPLSRTRGLVLLRRLRDRLGELQGALAGHAGR